MKGSMRDKRPSPPPDTGPPKLTQWAWLTRAMRPIEGSALWTSYLPTEPGRRRPAPASYLPAYTTRRAEGVNWGKLTDFLGTRLNNEGCRKAQVLVILSDNRPPNTIQHWEYTSRILVERSKFVNSEQLYFIWIPATQEAGLDGRHFTWTIAAVAKALTCNPGLDGKHLLFLDHDVTMLTLFDIDELVLESRQAYASSINAISAKGNCYPGLLTFSEENLNHNGGILLFPAKQQSLTLRNEPGILRGHRWVTNLVDKTKKFLLNKPEPRAFWGNVKNKIDLGRDTTLCLMGECLHQQQLLKGLPMHGSMAMEREDLAIAWDFLGEAITDTYFPLVGRHMGGSQGPEFAFDKRARMDFAHQNTRDNFSPYMQM